MKKSILFLLDIILFATFGQAQCAFSDIFPIEHGFSKFRATTTIAALKNIKENTEANTIFSSYNTWYKEDYMKGDSVFKFGFHFDYLYHNCFKGDQNDLFLHFVDDKLYKIVITLTFSNTKYDKCKENYDQLLKIFKENFIDWEPYNLVDTKTKEQHGQGFWFYPTNIEHRDSVKIENLSIDYSIVYEKKWNKSQSELYQTGNVREYIIRVNYYNLKGTKLTSEGY